MNEIVATQGHYLTQSAEVDSSNRVFVRRVMCADSQLESSWREADEAEKLAFEASQVVTF